MPKQSDREDDVASSSNSDEASFEGDSSSSEERSDTSSSSSDHDTEEEPSSTSEEKEDESSCAESAADSVQESRSSSSDSSQHDAAKLPYDGDVSDTGADKQVDEDQPSSSRPVIRRNKSHQENTDKVEKMSPTQPSKRKGAVNIKKLTQLTKTKSPASSHHSPEKTTVSFSPAAKPVDKAPDADVAETNTAPSTTTTTIKQRDIADIDESVHFDPSPTTNIIHVKPIPTNPLQETRMGSESSSHNEREASNPQREVATSTTETISQTKPCFDPSEVVKPSSLHTLPEQQPTSCMVSRVIGIVCLCAGILLLFAALMILIVTPHRPDTSSPRLQQYDNAMMVRDSAEQVLRELIKGTEAAASSISARSLLLDWPLMDDFELLNSLTRAKATILAPIVTLEKRLEWQNFAKTNTAWVETSRSMALASARINMERRLQNGSAVVDSVKLDDDQITTTDDNATTDSGGSTTTIVDNANDSVTIEDSATVFDDDFGAGTYNFFDPITPDFGQPGVNDGDLASIRVPFAIHAAPRGEPLGRDDDASEYLPVWQLSPIPRDDLSIVNFDMLRQPILRRLFEDAKTSRHAAVSPPFGNSRLLLDDAFVFDGALTNETTTSPLFAILQPIFNRIPQPNQVDGYLLNIYSWDDLAWRSPTTMKLVVENNCGSSSYAFEVTDQGSQYSGEDPIISNDMAMTTEFAGFWKGTSACKYKLSFYFSEGEDKASSDEPVVAIIVIILALVTVAVGTVSFVHALNRKHMSYDTLMDQGIREQGDQLKQFSGNTASKRSSWFRATGETGGKTKMKDDNVNDESKMVDTADATVVYATLDGFCDWSATCDANDAFSLLDHLNNTFDRLVKEYKLSKVDTVGNTFMAVCGVRQRRGDHVEVAANFIREFFRTQGNLAVFIHNSALEELGLSFKAGIHCGEVKASFRKSGFQISGVTVKEVQQMVSQADANTIYVSPTAFARLEVSDLSNYLETKERTDEGGSARCTLCFSPTKCE